MKRFGMFLVLMLCACPPKSEEEEPASESDTDTAPCVADLTVAMPDGTSTTLDFCVRSSMDATFEFDPDAPPEIRSPTLEFHAVTDEAFDCWVRITEPAACGEGYYRMDGSSGDVTFDIHDCTGVGDGYEAIYTSSTGYLRMDTFHAGDEAGNFSGDPLETTMAGYVSVTSAEGVTVTGDFLLRQEVTATDAEDAACVVSDGDEDDDGDHAIVFGGTDCDDSDSSVEGLDADADGSSTCEGDCDDSDSSVESLDADADGYSSCEGDCDDSNGGLRPEDADGDGWSTCDGDCDDSDSLLNRSDVDGDGWSSCAGDCEDDDANLFPYDSNGDGTLDSCGYTAVAAGTFHTCALNSLGAVECWGDDRNGNLSDAPLGSGYLAVSTGKHNSCVVTSSGAVNCWGKDDNGEVSDAPSDSGYTAVSGGLYHSCAIDSSGAIECWGDDTYGQVSDAP